MKVLKFGGSSVGTPQRMKDVLRIISSTKDKKIVVLSAMSGTTDKLKKMVSLRKMIPKDTLGYYVNEFKKNYLDVVEELFEKQKYKEEGRVLVEAQFDQILNLLSMEEGAFVEKKMLSFGELLSTGLFYLLCLEKSYPSILMPALDFMRINEELAPDYERIKDQLETVFPQELEEETIVITQGFICRNVEGEVDNLGRGGSDYTATILGAVTNAEEIQIWTDIDGIHNNDPRYVDNTISTPEVSFDQASRLSYFGAKILHPSCVKPARERGIPIRIKNTFDPPAPGTLILRKLTKVTEAVVSAKDNESLINIQSNNQLTTNVFFSKILEVLRKYKIEIDMISMACESVSLVANIGEEVNGFEEDIKEYGAVDIDSNFSIINIVGQCQEQLEGDLSPIFDALKGVPIRMISHKKGAEGYLLILIESKDKRKALNLIHRRLYGAKEYWINKKDLIEEKIISNAS